MRTIHVWCQSYHSSPGGIQTFTRFVVRALRELYPEAQLVVFAKNDLAKAESGNRKSEIGVADSKSNPNRIVGFGHWPSTLRAAAFALSAVRHAKREQPELIVSTHVNLSPVVGLAKKVSAARFAAIGHGIEVWKIHKASVRRALRAADELIAVSDFTRVRMAKEVGIEADAIALLPNTFDDQRFAPGPKSNALLQRYGISEKHTVILTVARMEASERYKGYENVLLAMPGVLARFPNTRYLIVGDGPDRKRVEMLSRDLRVEGKVIFAGYIPNKELPGHYNLCDVFAMPSKGEGFGIVFLEALGCGKPAIAGNKDGSVEPLLNGKLGKLVDPDSVEQIGNAICATLMAGRQADKTTGRRTTEVGSQTSEIGGGEAVGEEGAARLRVPGYSLSVIRGDSEAESEGPRGAGGRQDDKTMGRRPAEPQLDPELLRREVIAAFGYERFRERLGAIIEKLKS